MKQMIYQFQRINEILDEGFYNGFHYIICSYGTHPCAYVQVPETHDFYGMPYDDIEVDCHGGLTYGRFAKNGTYWIGWDYAHYGDYVGYYLMRYGYDAKKWTTEEIYEDVKYVIDQLNGSVNNEKN